MRRFLFIAGVVAIPLVVVLVLVIASIYQRIHWQSTIDEARKADIIVVLGAAEYNGRPSPTLRARLDHAHELYSKGFAQYVLTSGGAGGDPRYTEGEVGRDYLVKRGIPAEAIVVEEEADSTVQTILTVSEIMRRMNLKTAILVSDGYHIFRAKRILGHEGMQVYGSPRAHSPQGTFQERWLYVRQAFGYLLWRVGVNI